LISFDSNILVYAADPAAGTRRERSAELVARAMRLQSCTQALQSFCEFFNVITRKAGVEPAAAGELVGAWSAAMTVETACLGDLETAIRGVQEHGLSFWDAMLWATVKRAGVRTLITEDFQDGRTIEGVRIVNPFAAHNATIIDKELPEAGR
jgi:predicted nucleic acid-binding protein